jgi:hypothetical protein
MTQTFEKLVRESDKLASRLGPEIVQKIKNIGDSAEMRAVIQVAMGALTATVFKWYYFPYIFVSPMSDIIGPPVVGACLSIIPSLIIEPLIENRRYDLLKRNFPDKAEDIQRFRSLEWVYYHPSRNGGRD